jgi:flagellar hook assembly protein FlgD
VGFCSAAFGELQGVARIQEDLKTGRISYETSLLYRTYSLFEPSRLPSEYRDESRFVKSGTSLASEVRAAWPELSPSAKAVLSSFYSRPEYLPESYPSPSGRFLIHYTMSGSDAVSQEDTNGNGEPDYVEAAAKVFDSAYVLEVEELGYKEPVRDGTAGGDRAWDVYIRALWGSRTYGYTTPEKKAEGYGYTSYVEIDNNFEDGYSTSGLDALRVTAAHEFFHVIHFSYYGLGGLVWWMEICSTWMEDVAYDEVNDYYYYLDYFFDYPEKALDTQNDRHEYGACIFAHYLSKRFGPEVIRDIWEEIGASGQRDMRPFNRVIPGGMESAMKEFAVWNYFTGSRAQPDRYYPEGADYPEIRVKKQHTEYPETGAEGAGTLEHLSAHYIQFSETQDKPGGLSATFDPEESNAWSGMLVGWPSGNDTAIWPMNDGEEIIVGWGTFREIFLIAAVTSPTGYGFRYAYNVSATPDSTSLGQDFPDLMVFEGEETEEVCIPFDLAVQGQVTLSIYTLQGLLVRRIELGVLPPGYYRNTATWDGKDEQGRCVNGGMYFFRLEVQSDSESFEAVQKIAVIQTDGKDPESFSLGQSWPNPFVIEGQETEKVCIPFDSTVLGKVTLSIYTLQGTLVRRIELEPDHYSYLAQWNGKNERGRLVSSGIYLYRLEVQSDSESFDALRKMAVIRAE